MVSKPKNPTSISRRHFLLKAGMATGIMATFPLQCHARFLSSGHTAPRIGVLVPRSPQLPLLGDNLVSGMMLQFSAAGWEKTQLIVQEFGPGSALAAARKLVLDDQVDILTGVLNPNTVLQLRDLLEKTNTIFINIEGGANAFAPREESPLIYHNSFGYWQSNWAMGNWATGIGRRAFVASSFYESGYDSMNAFPQGFIAAGGKVIATEVSHIPPAALDLGPIMAAIKKARPDLVFAAYSGRDGVDFVHAYSAAGLAGRIPLLASGFMVDEALLRAMGNAALGIKSCLPWALGLQSPENIAFQAAFSNLTGRDADPFAVLGNDTARLITAASGSNMKTARNSTGFGRGLVDAGFTGARGRIHIDPATGNTDTPLYLREVRRSGTTLHNNVLAELPRASDITRLADLNSLCSQSGWTNSYLCA